MLTLGWTGRSCPVAASGASALPPPPPSAVSATTATTAIRTTPPATRASIRRDIGTSIGTGRTAAARAGVEPGGVLPPPAGEPAACRQRRRARRAPAATTADHPEHAEVECIEGAGKRGQKRPSVARTCARAFVIPRICPLTCGALRWRSLGSVLRCARECSCPSQSTAGGCKGVAAWTDNFTLSLGIRKIVLSKQVIRDLIVVIWYVVALVAAGLMIGIYNRRNPKVLPPDEGKREATGGYR